MSKVFRRIQQSFVLILLSTSMFFGGYYFGHRGFQIDIKKNPPAINVSNIEPKEQNVDFAIFWEVWKSLNDNYIDRPLDAQALIYGAVGGMVAAAGDDYTSYFKPDQNTLAKSSLSGSYEGIGAELGFKDKYLVVIAPLDGSPAQKSGVRAGDRIVEIEGEPTIGITLADAVTSIRGPSGTTSTLKLQRGEEEPFEVKIVRGKIVTKSVAWKDLGDGVAHLRLSRFGDNTMEEWRQSVDQMVAQMPNLKGVILDVRGNPGGYLSASELIASEFLSPGKTVLFEENALGQRTERKASRSGKLTETKIVVLLDKGSASASEIVTAALRDNDRAKIVGTTSFGKGSIQTSEEFGDGSSLHVTIAKWLTPKKEWVHKTGIKPDFEVELSEEDVTSGKDPQLDKAKEVILNEAQ